jgi:hypothetical protein
MGGHAYTLLPTFAKESKVEIKDDRKPFALCIPLLNHASRTVEDLMYPI